MVIVSILLGTHLRFPYCSFMNGQFPRHGDFALSLRGSWPLSWAHYVHPLRVTSPLSGSAQLAFDGESGSDSTAMNAIEVSLETANNRLPHIGYDEKSVHWVTQNGYGPLKRECLQHNDSFKSFFFPFFAWVDKRIYDRNHIFESDNMIHLCIEKNRVTHLKWTW